MHKGKSLSFPQKVVLIRTNIQVCYQGIAFPEDVKGENIVDHKRALWTRNAFAELIGRCKDPVTQKALKTLRDELFVLECCRDVSENQKNDDFADVFVFLEVTQDEWDVPTFEFFNMASSFEDWRTRDEKRILTGLDRDMNAEGTEWLFSTFHVAKELTERVDAMFDLKEKVPTWGKGLAPHTQFRIWEGENNQKLIMMRAARSALRLGKLDVYDEMWRRLDSLRDTGRIVETYSSITLRDAYVDVSQPDYYMDEEEDWILQQEFPETSDDDSEGTVTEDDFEEYVNAEVEPRF